MKKELNKQQGFTLIELMIVVAIIGILAAIAIPQFSAYRIKAFNSTAESDLRNIMTAEEAAYADSQAYAADGTTGTGPESVSGLSGAKVSKNVTYSVNTFSSNSAYTIYTGHSNGDKSYAGDNTGLMRYKDESSAPDATAYTAQLTSSWGTGAL